MRRLRAMIIIGLVMAWPMVSFADQVTLSNGDRITGAIQKSDDKTLTIKSDLAGDVNIKWEAITNITSTQPLHLTLKDGHTVAGTVTTQDSKFVVATKDANAVDAPKDTVVAVRSDDEQKTYDAAMDRLKHPHFADLWSGQLDTGLSLTRGNSASLTYTLSGKAIRQTKRDKITLYMTQIYGTNDNTIPHQVVSNEIRSGARADINISERLFGFVLTDFDTNALQHLDLQNDIGGGLGFHVYKSKNTTFDLSGGITYNQEYFSAYTLPNPTPPPPTTPFAAITQKSTQALAGEELDTKIAGGRTTFSENFTFYPEVSGSTGYRYTFNANSATKINNWLGWQVTFTDNYLSTPPFGIKSNDLLLSTGLRLTLGKAPTP
jgi:putative salt-induced outer membrane protein